MNKQTKRLKYPKRGSRLSESHTVTVNFHFSKKKGLSLTFLLATKFAETISKPFTEFWLRKNNEFVKVSETEYVIETSSENLNKATEKLVEEFFAEHPSLDRRKVKVEFT